MAILYAHRGASAELPENTLPAYQRALELGADAIELDAHMTRDHIVMISHDPSGRRMCGVDAEIRRSTAAEVKEWDAGFGYEEDGRRPYAGQGITMPTFDEVLEELPDTPINIDLKQIYPSMVRTAIAVIRSHNAEERVTIASFHWLTLAEVRGRGYRGATSLSRPETLALLAGKTAFRAMPLTGTAAQLPVTAGPLHLDRPAFIERCHDLGLRLDYWTVNDPAEAERLLALGADGIMTDDPRRVAAAFPGKATAS